MKHETRRLPLIIPKLSTHLILVAMVLKVMNQRSIKSTKNESVYVSQQHCLYKMPRNRFLAITYLWVSS
jgi:hypothetical protein